MEDRKKYIDDVSSKVNQWDKQIIAMENQSTGKDDETYKQNVVQLKERNEELKARLEKLKNSGDDAWEMLNKEFEEGFDEMLQLVGIVDDESSNPKK